MARIEHVDAELFGVEIRPVLPFARDERVESCRGRLRDQRTSRAGHDPNPLHALGPERESPRRCTERFGQCPAQLLPRSVVLAPDAGGGTVVRAEIAANLYLEHSGKHGVVSDIRMTVERKVCGVEGDVSLDRKSTRLNSSHGYISYAVFCLKKKKIS